MLSSFLYPQRQRYTARTSAAAKSHTAELALCGVRL
jgi:hypothetical protein